MLGGTTATLSLNVDTDLPGKHSAQIHALTLTPATSATGGYCEVLPSLDIVDTASGKTLLHVETTITYPRALTPTPVRGRL